MNVRNFVFRFRGPLTILVIVLLANALFLTGIFKGNPFDQFSRATTFTHSGIYGLYSTIDPNNAYTTQALGHEAASNILHGHMPWWNYNEQVGAPLAGEMQSAALFLPFTLLLYLANGVLYFHIVLELIAGIATYYVLKRLKCSTLAATFGGSLFALNGTFAWLGAADFNPVAFLPLLILGLEIALDKAQKGKKGGWLLIALALAFSIYGGFPEAAFLDGLLAAVWFIVRAIQHKDEEWRSFTLKAVGGFVVGVFLAAPILIAFKDYLPYANIGGHAGALSKYSLPASTLPAQFMPYIYGPIFQFASYDHSGVIAQFWDNSGGYITLSVLFLAIFGLIAHRKKDRVIVYTLGAFALVILARIYGFPGFVTILNFIPGVKETAFYRYVNPTLELCVSILAAIGLDALLRAKNLNRRHILTAASSVVLLVLLLIPVALHEDNKLYLAPHHHLWLAASYAWSIGSVIVIVLIAFFLKKYMRWLIPLIVVADVLIMFAAPELSAPRSTIIDLAPVQYLQQNLGNSRFYSMGYIMPNYGSYFGIAAINTNNMPVAESWTKYITQHLNPNVNPLQEFTGVDELSPTGLTPAQAFLDNLPSYENIGVKYVVVSDGTLAINDVQSHALLSVFSDGNFTIYRLPSPKPYFQILKGTCKVTNTQRAYLTADCASPSALLRRELYMSGWTATVNGKKVAVSKSGSLFQSIKLPKGKSVVKFNYSPPQIGLAYLAFVIALGAIVYPYAKRRNSETKLTAKHQTTKKK
jgi:hypothetical protein